MIGALFRKEVRDLRPFIWLGVFVLVLEVCDWLLVSFDGQPLQRGFDSAAYELGMTMFLLSFAVGTGMLIREVDDRTLGFLDGLPLTRLQVFGTKFVTAAGVLLVFPAGLLLIALLQHVFARGSLDQALHPVLLLQEFALICLVVGVGLALGMWLGFLRSLCWLVVALLVVTLKLVELGLPAIAVWNPVELLRPRFIGVHWQVSGTALAVQAGLLVGALLLSLALFMRADGGQSGGLRARLSRPVISALVMLFTLIGLFAAFALVMKGYEDRAQERVVKDKAPGTEFTISPAGSARTRYYSFSYPAQSSSRTQDLLANADDLYLAVARILNADQGARIDVDLSGSLQNTEGSAFFERIRMRVGTLSHVTLAHETAHVLAMRLAGGEQQRELSKMTTLNEGMAEWIGNEVAGGGALTEQIRFTAALVSRRHLVTIEQTMDMDALARVADQNLKYPLGAVLVDATIKRYGQGALHKLMVTIGNPEFPRGLKGPELWHAAYQAAGFDLALVEDDYARQIKSWESEFADRIAALPRPRGSLVTRKGRVGVRLRFEGTLPEGWKSVARFRPHEDSSLIEYYGSVGNEQGIAWLAASRVAGKDVCFQPGVIKLEGRGLGIFEPWLCLPRDSAVELKE